MSDVQQSLEQIQATLRFALDKQVRAFVAARQEATMAERELSEIGPRLNVLGAALHDRMLAAGQSSADMIQVLGNYVEFLEAQYALAKTAAADTKTELTHLKEALGGHRAQAERHKTHIEQLTTTGDVLQRELALMKDTLAAKDRDIAVLRAEPAELRQRISQLESHIANAAIRGD